MNHQEEIRLSELAEKKFDGTISKEEAKVLESMLMKDRDARRFFLYLSSQHAELTALGESLAVGEILAANRRPPEKVTNWPALGAAAAVLFGVFFLSKWQGPEKEGTLASEGNPASGKAAPEAGNPESRNDALAMKTDSSPTPSNTVEEEVFGAPAQFEILSDMKTKLLEGGVVVRLTKSAYARRQEERSGIELNEDTGKVFEQDFLNTVQFSVEFDAQALIDEGIDPEDLEISFLNPASNEWEETDSFVFDFSSGTITATASPIPILAGALAPTEAASVDQGTNPTGTDDGTQVTEATDTNDAEEEAKPPDSTEEEQETSLLEGALAGSTELGGGWYSSPWLGLFYYDSSTPDNYWVYQSQLTWIYLSGRDSTNVWIYSENPHLGWTWTNSHQFKAGDNTPTDYLYRHADSRWIYFENVDGVNRYYEFKTGAETVDPGWKVDQ